MHDIAMSRALAMCKLSLPWIIGVHEILVYGLESSVDPRERKGNQMSTQVFINYSTTSDSSMFCAPSKFLMLHKEKLEGCKEGAGYQAWII